MSYRGFNQLTIRALPPLLLLLNAASTHALADDSELSEDYFFAELPVVLSATRLSQPLSEIPAAMTIIDREMIRATGAMNIPDLMRLVPGMTVGFYSGSRATVSNHGLADEYARDMQVLVDGRSIYDPGYGGVSWPDMPIELDEIARIEVVRGPNASAYGSNSYAGVINIITEHPADQLGTTLKTIVGEGDKRSIYGRHADLKGNLSYRVSASYDEYGGFNNIPDDERTKWLSFHGDYAPNEKDSFQVILGASDGNYDEGFNEVAEDVRDLDNNYNFQQLNWQRQISSSNEIKIQFYHNYLEIDDELRSPPLSEVITDNFGADPDDLVSALTGGLLTEFDDFLSATELTDSPLAISFLGFKSHRYDLELQQTLSSVDDLRLVWGAGLRQDSIEGIWLFHTDDRITRDQARLFGNLEWRLHSDWIANIGGMLEWFEQKQTLFSPRLALNYHYDSYNTFRASASRAYRMPTLYEDHVQQMLFLNGPLDDLSTWRIATEDLDPQRIDSYELGYFGNFPQHNLIVDFRLFHEKHTNIIDELKDLDIPNPDQGLTGLPLTLLTEFLNATGQTGAFTFSNSADAKIRGLEASLHFKPTPANLIYLGYSYLDADGYEIRRIGGGRDVFDSDELGNAVPDHTFSLLASHRFDNGFQVSSAYYFMDDLDWPGDGDEVPSFSRWDLRFAKDFKTYGMDGEISLLIQNLGEENTDFFEDEDTGQINIWDRRAFLQTKLDFH